MGLGSMMDKATGMKDVAAVCEESLNNMEQFSKDMELFMLLRYCVGP
jgi:hypothetical protein